MTRPFPVDAPPSGLLPVAIALGAWQLLGRASSRTFPPPHRWAAALTTLYLDGRLTEAVLSTMVTVALALVAATVVGAAIGTVIGSSVGVDRVVAPSLDLLASVPGAAVVPLAILVLGTTRLTNVAVVALAVVWPILHNSAAAARAIPPVRLEAARTLGLTPLQRWRSVVLPSVAPGILLGVRVAASLSLIVTLLVDVLGISDGIGRLLIERQQHFDAAGAWGLLFVVGVLGYLISLAVGGLDRIRAHGLRSTTSITPADVVGDKSGRWTQWYREAIPLAEQRYERYLKARRDEEEHQR